MKWITICLLLSLGLATLPAHCASPDDFSLDRQLNSNVRNYSIEVGSVVEALAKISSDFHIRMGIEWETTVGPSRPVSINYANGSLLDLLKQIVSVEPLYKLTIQSGIVHVGKEPIVDDRRNFLNIRISSFEASNEYAFHASNRLHTLLLDLANSPQEKGGGCAGSWTVGVGDHQTTFLMRDASVREILDRLVLSAGFNIWLVTFPEAKSITEKGFYKTSSLFGPVSDSAQPMWDLLLPGFDPSTRSFPPGSNRSEWPPAR